MILAVMTGNDYSLFGLFVSSFLSSTLLPGTSEVVLVILATQGNFSRWNLLTIATAGNTLGGMTSWGLGCLLAWWYPLSALAKPSQRLAVERIRLYGSPMLLLSWVPFIGDPLCLAAGWLRITWVNALFFIGIGKACRYPFLLAFLPGT